METSSKRVARKGGEADTIDRLETSPGLGERERETARDGKIVVGCLKTVTGDWYPIPGLLTR